MNHAVTSPRLPIPIAEGQLTIHQVPAWQDNFVWLIVSPQRKEAAAVDGPDAKEALAACARLGVRLTTILNTHTHGDHIGINTDLSEKLETIHVIGSASRAREIPGLKQPVSDGDQFELFGTTVQVMLTEGHLNGHVSYLIDNALFCGDTLFGAGCGYLFDGPPVKMLHSLKRFANLPGNTWVFCAHEYTADNLRFAWSVEPDNQQLKERIQHTWVLRSKGEATIPSTIQLELATNPFMRTSSVAIQQALKKAFPERSFASDLEVFAAIRELKDLKRYRNIDDGELPVNIDIV
ncbi:MAG: hydroxyacylglutathione hydrolase [Myxococcales bacterium]|nr:hydroxyacylglutathione hydrolase [Myxococcales bacterium]